MLGPYKFRVQKILNPKDMVHKILGPDRFGCKEVGFKQKFESKPILSKKIISKKLFDPNRLDQKTN